MFITKKRLKASLKNSEHGGKHCCDDYLKMTSDTEAVCSVCEARFRWNGETGVWNLEGNAPNGKLTRCGEESE
jgi:hypothetical protein